MSRRRWGESCVHHLVLLVALVSLLTLLVPVSRVTAEDPVVVFADPYLESAIRGQIWPPNYDGPIHQSEITPIRGVGVTDRGVVSLSELKHRINLEGVDVSGNQISDISSLSGLTNLRELSLNTNQIGDIEPLVNNPGIDAGDWIDLRSNPLSSESINTWIPALLARGVGVAWDQNPPPPASTIAGYVEDGYDHNLGGVEVTLIDVSSG